MARTVPVVNVKDKRSRTKYQRLAFFVCIAATTLVAWLFMLPESYDHADAKLLEYTMNGDGEGLLSYMDPGEVKLAGADKSTLSNFLNSFLRQRLNGFEVVGRARVGDYGTCTGYSHEFRGRDGRRCFFTYLLRRDGRRVVACPMIDNLLYGPFFADWPSNLPAPHSTDAYAFKLAQLERYLPDLKSSGLRGTVTGEPFDLKVTSWDDLRFRFTAELARFRQAGALVGPNPPRSYHSAMNLVP